MRCSYSLLILFLLCSSCDEHIETNRNEKAISEIDNSSEPLDSLQTSTLIIYQELAAAIIKRDTALLNRFIHPNSGLWVIESNGAMPSARKLTSIPAFDNANKKKHIFNFDTTHLNRKPLQESLPLIDCNAGPDFYTKTGCFIEETNPLISTELWKYCNVDDDQQIEIEQLTLQISATVVNTSEFTAYFGKMDNKWYLLFIDIRTPCEA